MRKLLGAVDNGRNLDQIATHPIDNAIVLEDELPKLFSSVLRYNPARQWELTQLLDVENNALNEEACVMRRIPCDLLGDGVEVEEG